MNSGTVFIINHSLEN